MSALDAEVYHGYLAELRPDDLDAVVLDVGGGDGRNAVPWLRWGFRRVVVVDPVRDALARLRERLAAEHADWLNRVLLIEADARQLPLRERCADRVQAIESLAYLNGDYSSGLVECTRVLADGARLLVADRDYEGGLLARLFYGGGVRGMLEQAPSRDIWDGNNARVRAEPMLYRRRIDRNDTRPRPANSFAEGNFGAVFDSRLRTARRTASIAGRSLSRRRACAARPARPNGQHAAQPRHRGRAGELMLTRPPIASDRGTDRSRRALL